MGEGDTGQSRGSDRGPTWRTGYTKRHRWCRRPILDPLRGSPHRADCPLPWAVQKGAVDCFHSFRWALAECPQLVKRCLRSTSVRPTSEKWLCLVLHRHDSKQEGSVPARSAPIKGKADNLIRQRKERAARWWSLCWHQQGYQHSSPERNQQMKPTN